MGACLSLSGSGRKVGWGGRLFEAGRLLTFSAFRMGAYSRWTLIRVALIRINTVTCRFPEGGRLKEDQLYSKCTNTSTKTKAFF